MQTNSRLPGAGEVAVIVVPAWFQEPPDYRSSIPTRNQRGIRYEFDAQTSQC
jgi:hypothetical protein